MAINGVERGRLRGRDQAGLLPLAHRLWATNRNRGPSRPIAAIAFPCKHQVLASVRIAVFVGKREDVITAVIQVRSSCIHPVHTISCSPTQPWRRPTPSSTPADAPRWSSPSPAHAAVRVASLAPPPAGEPPGLCVRPLAHHLRWRENHPCRLDRRNYGCSPPHMHTHVRD
jgi:hypothetical protein